MKTYALKITDTALADMNAIYDYIAEQLLSPDTAMGQYDRIASTIETLASFPERCALLRVPFQDCGEMRQLRVNNYTVVFVVGEAAVTVLRVLYSASDIGPRLLEQ